MSTRDAHRATHEAKRDPIGALRLDDDEPEAPPVCGSCGAELEHAGDECWHCGEDN